MPGPCPVGLRVSTNHKAKPGFKIHSGKQSPSGIRFSEKFSEIFFAATKPQSKAVPGRGARHNPRLLAAK